MYCLLAYKISSLLFVPNLLMHMLTDTVYLLIFKTYYMSITPSTLSCRTYIDHQHAHQCLLLVSTVESMVEVRGEAVMYSYTA